MAHKKGTGATGKNRDSISKRLGVKLFGGELARSGDILIRQKGSHFYPGIGTRQGNDFTIYAVTEGRVQFSKKRGRSIVEIHG